MKGNRYGRNSSIQVRNGAIEDLELKRYHGISVKDMVNPKRKYKLIRPVCDNLEKSISWSIAKESAHRQDYISVIQK